MYINGVALHHLVQDHRTVEKCVDGQLLSSKPSIPPASGKMQGFAWLTLTALTVDEGCRCRTPSLSHSLSTRDRRSLALGSGRTFSYEKIIGSFDVSNFPFVSKHRPTNYRFLTPSIAQSRSGSATNSCTGCFDYSVNL